MDIFAHVLWSFAIFSKRSDVWWAVLFGVLPDLLSFGILFFMNLFTGNLQRGPPALSTLPKWLFTAYTLTHSLVLFAAVFLLVFLITKSWYWPLAAWAIHILIDIPTHSAKFFPTPFLWPISNYNFNGISWGTPWFMIINYISLSIVFVLMYFKKI